MRFPIAGLGKVVERHRGLSLMASALLTLAGIDLALFPPKGHVLEWLALPFLGAGLGLLALTARRPGLRDEDGPPTLAAGLIRRLTFGGRLIPWLPIPGIAIVLADLAYNAYLSASPQVGAEDTFALLFGGALLAYPYVPTAFRRERDFVLVALTSLFAILVLPLLAARAYSRNWEYSVDLYSWAALAYQVSAVVGLAGVPAIVHPVPGSTAPGLTVMTHGGTQITLVITTACSGLYSFGLFASAFFAYVLTEFRTLSWRVWAFLALGALTSYVANILRMALIVLSGVYADTPQESVQNLLVAHSYAGWLIFLAWIGLFWILLARFLGPAAAQPQDGAEVGVEPLEVRPRRSRRGASCGICRDLLTPGLPGYRCECGMFYHASCAATEAACHRCRRPLPQDRSASAARS